MKQTNITIIQYDREFHKLSHLSKSLVAMEKDRMKRFVNGLKPTIQKDLSILDLAIHVEALDKALKVERAYNQLDQ